MKVSALKCGIAFGKMGICSLITQMMEPVLNMLRKQPHDERGDASTTPERFFLVFRHSNCKYFVNKRYTSLKFCPKRPFRNGIGNERGNSLPSL